MLFWSFMQLIIKYTKIYMFCVYKPVNRKCPPNIKSYVLQVIDSCKRNDMCMKEVYMFRVLLLASIAPTVAPSSVVCVGVTGCCLLFYWLSNPFDLSPRLPGYKFGKRPLTVDRQGTGQVEYLSVCGVSGAVPRAHLAGEGAAVPEGWG